MAKIGYIRVSTEEQNIDRQKEALDNIGVSKMFIEKKSGKDMEREQLREMLKFIREGDVVYIESISRLARSTKDLLNIVEQFTSKKVDLISLKENIDTTTSSGRFTLTLFAALSQLERENILERQREGIDIAIKNGVKFGRPKVKIPNNWDDIINDWVNGRITAVKAMEILGMSRGTFYRKVKELGIKKKEGCV